MYLHIKILTAILFINFIFPFAVNAHTVPATAGICPAGHTPKTYSGVTGAPSSCEDATSPSKIVSLECPAGSQPVYDYNTLSVALGAAAETTKSALKTILFIGGITAFPSPSGLTIQGDPIGCVRSASKSADCIIAKGEQPLPQNDGSWLCSIPPSSITRSGDLNLPDASAIKQPIRPYQVSFPIPCKVLPGVGGECPGGAAGIVKTPAQYITRLYQFGLMIVGFAAFASIVYGAIKYILSAGGMAEQKEAKEQMTDAVLGLILLLGAFLILYTINPALVNLRNPTLEPLSLDVLLAPEPGQELQQLTGGGEGTGAGDLCKLKVNAKIDVSVSANTQAKLPSGTQTASKCLSCKNNASKDSSGVCQCDSGFENVGGECLPACPPGAGPERDPAGKFCLTAKQKEEKVAQAAQSECKKQGGVCEIDRGPSFCNGKIVGKLCPGPDYIKCCLPQK